MMEIHIMLAGVEVGPLSESQVRQYLAEGLISPSDPAKHVGMKDWEAVDILLAKLPKPDRRSPLTRHRFTSAPLFGTFPEPRSSPPPSRS